MSVLLVSCICLNIVSFIFYGMGSFFSKNIQEEFSRFGLPWLRIPTGILQILASLALLLGFYRPLLLFFGSAFLSLMMLVALVVRWRIRDLWHLCLPALFYLILNLFIFAQVGGFFGL